jgi:hypothetical protein
MSGEVSYTATIIANLNKLASAFLNGDPGLNQWKREGTKSIGPLSGGDQGDPAFEEAVQLAGVQGQPGKYDETSAALAGRVDLLQEALRGVSQIATDISKALVDGSDAAVDTAIALLPRLVTDVLKRPPQSDKPA